MCGAAGADSGVLPLISTARVQNARRRLLFASRLRIARGAEVGDARRPRIRFPHPLAEKMAGGRMK